MQRYDLMRNTPLGELEMEPVADGKWVIAADAASEIATLRAQIKAMQETESGEKATLREGNEKLQQAKRVLSRNVVELRARVEELEAAGRLLMELDGPTYGDRGDVWDTIFAFRAAVRRGRVGGEG